MRRSSSLILSSCVLGVRRDDRVVVGDLLVVDHARERQHVEPGDVRGGLRVLAAGRRRAAAVGLISRDHVARQEARVGARIGERLVLLVAALRRGERAPRGEAEARVGLALQRRQVVEQRRAFSVRSVLSSLVISPGWPRTASTIASASSAVVDPRLGAGVEAARRSGARRRSARTARRRASRARARTRGSPPRGGRGSRASASARGRATRRRRTTQRRRIVAARVAFMPTIQSASERERAACLEAGRAPRAGRRCANASFIAVVGHRRQPQPLDRLLRAGLLEEVGEDQLALAAGVAGVDDLVDVVALELRA